jgi:hypothetical protein
LCCRSRPAERTTAGKATLLQTEQDLALENDCNGRLIISGLPETPPHPIANTIRIEFDSEPTRGSEIDKAGWIEGKV